jgi:hypothetical protein
MIAVSVTLRVPGTESDPEPRFRDRRQSPGRSQQPPAAEEHQVHHRHAGRRRPRTASRIDRYEGDSGPQHDEQPTSPYPRPRTRRTGVCTASAADPVLDSRVGDSSPCHATRNWDNESARRNRRPGRGRAVPAPVRPLGLDVDPQGSCSDGDRQPRTPTPPQVR